MLETADELACDACATERRKVAVAVAAAAAAYAVDLRNDEDGEVLAERESVLRTPVRSSSNHAVRISPSLDAISEPAVYAKLDVELAERPERRRGRRTALCP